MSIEKNRLAEHYKGKETWLKWGPYLSERQWSTVREDYSADGSVWKYTTHDMARQYTYRWGEEGIGGICDDKQHLCFAITLWNKKDPFIKEIFFGMGTDGNHGEDVKELYYYLDSTPTHSYMKFLYKYPLNEFPYSKLRTENMKRTRKEPEYELVDTGIFDKDEYLDVFVEYAKKDVNDICIKITAHNRSGNEVQVNLLPQVWFRNVWQYRQRSTKPVMMSSNIGGILIDHFRLGKMMLHAPAADELLFCENETNPSLFGKEVDQNSFYKDGINEYIVNGNLNAVNPKQTGTKAACNYNLTIPAHENKTIYLQLTAGHALQSEKAYEHLFEVRKAEADEFYADLQHPVTDKEEREIQRQAFAGMMWSKQYYFFNMYSWLNGDPSHPAETINRTTVRNSDWPHLHNANIISMPDKWEYPWYAGWDLAFHCVPLAMIDASFAKQQILLLTQEWYMHPNGQLPAYEWNFSDVNPPVQAWAAMRVFELDARYSGQPDYAFLEAIFHKLMLNFTWWVNRKDSNGNNIFQGGFLGLDNIGTFDRSAELPTGGYLEQSDGTGWMAMYCLNMLRISSELSTYNPVYQDMATKFFEHFLYIAEAMTHIGEKNIWDEEDRFFYDIIMQPDNSTIKLKVRSLIGVIPLYAVEVFDHDVLLKNPQFARRARWLLENRPDIASLVSRWREPGVDQKHLLSILFGDKLKSVLTRLLDEAQFLSEYGIRALSKEYDEKPFELEYNGIKYCVQYMPGESDIDMFGGNSNWRGPVWFPVNYLLIESLLKFHYYYGDNFKVEFPTGSGKLMSLEEVATELNTRLINIFKKNAEGHRAVYGHYDKLQNDPQFNKYILFYEYFHGDNGRGVGASHQTGWTGLVAKMIQPRYE
ncbi:glucosidase [Chitinophagaceae bacterium 26-R-25]|nr:glucosidase [Chitinophagaceae bacterium 26-R-25]